MSTYRSEEVFDHVASGCVWSGDAYASTRNATQTSGVVYIAGVRLPVAAVSARLYTASKDTYIDVNGSGVQVYTEVTNNAASPALTAGNIRIGIIITGATTIAAATSVNQGQESMILPIASSAAYSVSDSLGNLICSRDPLRRILCIRQATSGGGPVTSTGGTAIAPLSAPVIIPTGRKVKITAKCTQFTVGASTKYAYLQIWDGTVGSGTKLDQTSMFSTLIAQGDWVLCEVTVTPTATSKTYNAGIASDADGATTASYVASSSAPIYIKVELV